MDIRVGFGVDIHKLLEGRELIIGGVKIESELGSLGHSDADVLLHAICDALLGAANLRDIGYHFPDTDPTYKDADSRDLLLKSYEMVREKGYVLGNLDATVLLEEPKLNPHIPEMQKNIGEVLKIDTDKISIKASRGEKLGFIGKQEGLQAYCSVLIYKV
ncbi:MAG: 2-C-methyl-D-erythritol 2,4-cyclodiphosphate synthase [Crocinitomicaceae bacterium]